MPRPAPRGRVTRVPPRATARTRARPTRESRARARPSRAQSPRPHGPPQDKTKIEDIAVERAEVETDPRLASCHDGVVTQRLAECVQGVAQGMARGALVRLGPEQRHQTVARVETGRFCQRQIDQQRDPFRLRELRSAHAPVARPKLDGAEQLQGDHEFNRGDKKVTSRGRCEPIVGQPIAHYSPLPQEKLHVCAPSTCAP